MSFNRYCAVMAGSGSAAFAERSLAEFIIDFAKQNRLLANRSETEPPIKVAYLGTATYDSDSARHTQTDRFAELGCAVVPINVTWKNKTKPVDELRKDMIDADILIVSGGNTLYAVSRWRVCGLDKIIYEMAEKGCILSGGSAGTCFYDALHSDSADPATFRPETDDPNVNVEKQSEKSAEENLSVWDYIRVSTLCLLPGISCPHHDRKQTNGVWRYEDFDKMLLRHPGERGMCLDHWCALMINRGEFQLFQVPGKEGSVVLPSSENNNSNDNNNNASSASSSAYVEDAKFEPSNGKPGMWLKTVDPKKPNTIISKCVAMKGKLNDIMDENRVIDTTLSRKIEDELLKRNPID